MWNARFQRLGNLVNASSLGCVWSSFFEMQCKSNDSFSVSQIFFFCIGFTLISFCSVSTDDGIYLLRLDARQHLYKVTRDSFPRLGWTAACLQSLGAKEILGPAVACYAPAVASARLVDFVLKVGNHEIGAHLQSCEARLKPLDAGRALELLREALRLPEQWVVLSRLPRTGVAAQPAQLGGEQ